MVTVIIAEQTLELLEFLESKQIYYSTQMVGISNEAQKAKEFFDYLISVQNKNQIGDFSVGKIIPATSKNKTFIIN